MELEVLKRYRDNEKPAEITVIEDKPLSILKREELIELAERRGVSVLEISRLGGLEPCHEIICVAKEKNKRPAQEQHQEVVNKKKKGAMWTSMEELRQEVKELKKQLEGKQSESLQTEFDRARADAKLEASKREVNVDVLFQKLVLLEDTARKLNSKDLEKYTMLITRFHIHKTKPSFVAALVLKNLCTKVEESILENEQKLMKSQGWGMFEEKTVQPTSFMGHDRSLSNNMSFMGMPGFTSQPTFPQHFYGQRMDMTRPSRPFRSPLRCYTCNKVGHIARECTELGREFKK